MKQNYFSAILSFLLLLLFTTKIEAQCSANFTYTNTGNTYNFTDASTATTGSIVSRTWNFGDLTAPSTSTNPSHTYTMCGVYNVSLTIITSAFCTNTYNTTITVNGGITASFTSNVDTTNGNTTFQATPASLSANYSWDFGDGSPIGSNAITNHTYPASGSYNVCLTVSDTGGLCTTTVCDTVIVYITPPTCNSTFTSNGLNDNVVFNASPFNINYDYFWDFGDGSGTGTGFVSNYTYTSPGTYYVCLTTVDSSTTCMSSFCDSVTVTMDTVCFPSFTYIDNNGTVIFTPTPLNPLNTYAWDYGDGNTGNIMLGTNIYATSGTYNACLTMTNQMGCTNTYCAPVTVTVVGIEELSAQNMNINLSPNPAQDHIKITYSLIAQSNVSIRIIDILGNIVYSENIRGTSGSNQTILDIKELRSGCYFVELDTNNTKATKKLIKK